MVSSGKKKTTKIAMCKLKTRGLKTAAHKPTIVMVGCQLVLTEISQQSSIPQAHIRLVFVILSEISCKQLHGLP